MQRHALMLAEDGHDVHLIGYAGHDVFPQLAAHERILHTGDRLSQLARQFHLRAERVQIRRSRFPLDPRIEKIARARHELLELLLAPLPDHRIGIFAGSLLAGIIGSVILLGRSRGQRVPT